MAGRKAPPPNPAQDAYDARAEDLAARRREVLAQFSGEEPTPGAFERLVTTGRRPEPTRPAPTHDEERDAKDDEATYTEDPAEPILEAPAMTPGEVEEFRENWNAALTDDSGRPVRADGTVIPETAEAVKRRDARVAGQ